ncbi:MAG: TRAP transporter small permease [Endozoicomonas sp.]
MMIKLLKLLNHRFEEFLCSLMLGYIAVSLNIEVFNRYVLNSPSAYTDEIARTLMIFIVFLGVPWAVKLDRHVIIDLLSPDVSPKLRLTFQLFSKTLFIVFCVLFSHAAVRAAEFHHMLDSVTEGLRLPLWLLLGILPFSFGLTVIRLIQSMHQCIRQYQSAVQSSIKNVETVEASHGSV